MSEPRITSSSTTTTILSGTSVEILPANDSRLGIEISNCNGTNDIYVRVGGTAVAGAGVAISKNTTWKPNKIITGQIVGIAQTGAHTVSAIEYL